jgi:hypothetical protein
MLQGLHTPHSSALEVALFRLADLWFSAAGSLFQYLAGAGDPSAGGFDLDAPSPTSSGQKHPHPEICQPAFVFVRVPTTFAVVDAYALPESID